jgi:hypothetical protein
LVFLEDSTRSSSAICSEISDGSAGPYIVLKIFHHPYTKIDFVMQELRVSRITATKYLDALANLGILSKYKKGKENYQSHRKTRFFRSGM